MDETVTPEAAPRLRRPDLQPLRPEPDEALDATSFARLTERILRVRPLARTVADAQFALAMDRRVQAEYAELLRQRREYGSEA